MEVDTIAIMRFGLGSIGQQDVNVSVSRLRDSLAVAVQKIAGLAQAVNYHANHFGNHHEGIAWSVRKIETIDQDAWAKMSLVNNRLEELNPSTPRSRT